MELFGDMESFLQANEDNAPTIRARLLGYFDDLQRKVYLHIETAIVVDVSMHFVKATL